VPPVMPLLQAAADEGDLAYEDMGAAARAMQSGIAAGIYHLG